MSRVHGKLGQRAGKRPSNKLLYKRTNTFTQRSPKLRAYRPATTVKSNGTHTIIIQQLQTIRNLLVSLVPLSSIVLRGLLVSQGYS